MSEDRISEKLHLIEAVKEMREYAEGNCFDPLTLAGLVGQPEKIREAMKPWQRIVPWQGTKLQLTYTIDLMNGREWPHLSISKLNPDEKTADNPPEEVAIMLARMFFGDELTNVRSIQGTRYTQFLQQL